MVRLFKALVWIFVGLCTLSLLSAGFVYYLAGRSIPDYDRSFTVQGSEGKIEIVRANYAIPHIFAEVENEVYFGLGFAHAQDRMWQMLMLRRTVQGRLSELFGETTLKTDELMRALDLYQISVDSVLYQTPDTLDVLNRYSDGVNAYLKAVQTEALGRGTPELWLFSPEIAPWTPADSIAVMKLLALQLSDKAAVEVMQARLALLLPPERLVDLFPDEQGEAIIALPEYAALFEGEIPADAPIETEHALYPLREPGFSGASNAWAVGQTRSASGGALMAADPHLKLTAPSIWMLARLQFPSGGVIGGTIPGIPAILVGRNSQFAWGLTTSYLDDQDLFIEKLNPNNPNQYLTPKGYASFEGRDVIINIKDAPGITVNVQKSRHGPVIDPKHWNISTILPKNHVATLGWTGLEPNDRSIEAALKLMQVRRVEDAPEALSLYHATALNVMMADRDTMGMQTAGRAPRRSQGHTSKGRIPSPGWLGQNDWTGYLPFEDNPSSFNPPSGVIANTNNRLVERSFPNHWSYDWGDDQRILRARKMLNDREFHTLDSLIEIQTDTVSPTARALLPLIARDLWYSGEPAAVGTVERRRQIALELLANWNGEMSEHDPEPLIYAAWTRNLQRRLIVDEVGTLAARMPDLRALFIERVYRDIDGASVWCDVVQTSRVEDCVEIARVALDESLLNLIEAYGDRMESWRWGGIHQAVHTHEVLGSIPLLAGIVNIIQDTPGGDNTLLRGKMKGHGDQPFLNVHGSGYRGVYDMADPEASVFIISTGQSGHFLSRHYDDLSQIWRRSEYIPMTLDPVLARGGNRGITILNPVEN